VVAGLAGPLGARTVPGRWGRFAGQRPPNVRNYDEVAFSEGPDTRTVSGQRPKTRCHQDRLVSLSSSSNRSARSRSLQLLAQRRGGDFLDLKAALKTPELALEVLHPPVALSGF
jgi:hypothetical protein